MPDYPDEADLQVEIPAPAGSPAGDLPPYRLLVVSDLAGAGGSINGPLREATVSLSPERFESVMAEASPSLTLRLTNPVVPGNLLAEVGLCFRRLRDFEPAGLLEQIDDAAPARKLRERLVARLQGAISAKELALALERAAAEDAGLAALPKAQDRLPATPSAAAVDSLLGQLDLGSGGTTPASPAGLIAQAAGGTGIPAEEAASVRAALAEVDRRLRAWITAVLHAPEVLALESAWRSLALLTSRLEFRAGLRLEVMHSTRAAVTDRFRQLVIDPVFDAQAPAPDVVIADYQFGSGAPDLEALDELAQHGASLPAVVLAGVGSSFLGVKHSWQVPTLPPFISLFDQWQFARWKSLRVQPYARSLGVVFGRALLRGRHEPPQACEHDFTYDEKCLAESELPWAGGAIMAALTIGRSVGATGWPTAMAGVQAGRLEGFPQAAGGRQNDKCFGPADPMLTPARAEEMAIGGINVLSGVPGHGDIFLWNGLSAGRPRQVEAGAFLEVSLGYQLFAARLSVLLLGLQPHLETLKPAEVAEAVNRQCADWLSFPADLAATAIQVQLGPLEGHPGVQQLGVSVLPPPTVLPGGIPVVLGLRLRLPC